MTAKNRPAGVFCIEGEKVGYFAFHGSPGTIRIGRKHIDLEHLGRLLEKRAQGKTLYFGSCSTVQVSDAELDQFKRTTGARVIAGFTKDVDWLESAAFDLLALRPLLTLPELMEPATGSGGTIRIWSAGTGSSCASEG